MAVNEKRVKIKKSRVKRVFQIITAFICLVALTILGYVAYVFIDYHRIADNQTLTAVNPVALKAETGKEYTVITWNLGFGAYSDDFTFFMDGGKQSRAYSESAVNANIAGAVEKLVEINPDFMLLQELDTDATRSYHVDERQPVSEAFGDMTCVFAVNYDSPYLFYPITNPHGASKSGIMTLSDYTISSAVRRSLPIESGFWKFLDLDRCFSVSRVELENGKQLVLINTHLSAYTRNGNIATKQLEILADLMKNEADAGNYVICGGDFNKDLLGNSPEVFGVSSEKALSWAQPIPEGVIPEGLKLVAGCDAENPVPTSRNTDIPYKKGVSFCAVIDGFIVSDNVEIISCENLDYGFENTDHNPVKLMFKLNG